MAKAKRLNKNVVAFLTVMGMLFAVCVVAVVFFTGVRRDPELLARQGREYEQRGEAKDLGEAAKYYAAAYATSNDQEIAYLLDATRCLFKAGALMPWREILERAHAKNPDEPRIIRTALDDLWRMSEIAGQAFLLNMWRDYSERLLRLAPDDLLGLCCRAWGHWDPALGEEGRRVADAAAEQAYALAPVDPHVAVTYARLLELRVGDALRQALEQGRPQREVQELYLGRTEEIAGVLAQAVAAHPEDGGTSIELANLSRMLAEGARRDGRLADAGVPLARAVEALSNTLSRVETGLAQTQAALTEPPADATALRALWERVEEYAWQLPGLYLSRAETHLERWRLARAAERPEDAAAALAEATADVERALERDPALYDAYMLRADLHLLTPGESSESPEGLVKRFEAALTVYERAAGETLMLRSMRASLGEMKRLILLSRALDTALGYAEAVQAQGGTEAAAAALARAQGFLEDARTKFPEHQLTAHMEGRHLATRRDTVGALKAFERAMQRGGAPREWLANWRVRALPQEHLADLYLADGQLGAARRNAEEALSAYVQMGRVPPEGLLLTNVDVLARLDEPRAALALLDRYGAEYAGSTLVRTARIPLLRRLGREADAARLEQEVVGADAGVPLRLWQAQQALQREAYDAAAETLRGIVSDAGATDGEAQLALALLLDALERAGHRAAAQEFVRGQLAAPARPALVARLRQYDVILSESDPARRDEKLLALIAQETDPVARAEQQAVLYERRGEWQKALDAVAALRQAQPDNPRVVEREFELRVRAAQQHAADGRAADAQAEFARADQLIAPLSQAGDGRGLDQAGGATYRGRLALARGDAETAAREYREAQRVLPNSDDLEVNLARAYLVAGRRMQAAEAAERALNNNPRNVTALVLLSEVYDQLADQTYGAEQSEYSRKAQGYFESLAKLAPEHPFVAQRQERVAEELDPVAAVARREAQRATPPADPMDAVRNLLRLAQLYPRAWQAANAAADTAGRERLQAGGNALFDAAVHEAPADARGEFARLATVFFLQTGQDAHGEQWLQSFRDGQTGLEKVSAQLLLAQFHAQRRDLPSADGAYRRAQKMVREEITDAQVRLRAELAVGQELIRFYERAGAPGRVVETCRWLLDQLPPDDAAVRGLRLQLSNALLGTRALGDAEAEIQAYVAAYGEDVGLLRVRASLHAGRNDRDAAWTDLTAILQQAPEDVPARLSRASLALRSANYEAAEADLGKARERIVPGTEQEFVLQSLLADLYERTERIEQAITAQRARLDLADRSGAADRISDAVRALVQTHERAGQLDRAQQLISEYMERHPAQVIWPWQLGQLLVTRAAGARARGERDAAERDERAAANYYQRVAERLADAQEEGSRALRVQALAAQIEALTRAGQLDAAVGVYEGLALQNPPPALRLAIATTWWARGEREKATREWRLALLDAAGRDVGLTSQVAEALRAALQPGDVDQLVRSVIEPAPADVLPTARLKIILADHLMRTGRPAEALPMLDEVVTRLPATAAERVPALVARARARELSGNLDGAIEDYRQVLNLDENVLALNNLAYLLVTARAPGFPRPAEALRYAERLEGLVTNDATAMDILDTIGWVYYQYAVAEAGQRQAYLERALGVFERAALLQRDASLTVLEHMGQVCVELGRKPEARRAYDRGLRGAQQRGDAERAARFQELIDRL